MNEKKGMELFRVDYSIRILDLKEEYENHQLAGRNAWARGIFI